MDETNGEWKSENRMKWISRLWFDLLVRAWKFSINLLHLWTYCGRSGRATWRLMDVTRSRLHMEIWSHTTQTLQAKPSGTLNQLLRVLSWWLDSRFVYRLSLHDDFSFFIFSLLLVAFECTRLTIEQAKISETSTFVTQWQNWQLKVKNNVNFFFPSQLSLVVNKNMRMSFVSFVVLDVFHIAHTSLAIWASNGVSEWGNFYTENITTINDGSLDKMINDWGEAANVW